MLKQIRIKNFRSYADSTLDFTPGLNVILGDPQNGKSNIQRAFIWVARNRPLGNRVHSRFMREGDVTEVEVTVTDKYEKDRVIRKVKPLYGKARYYLDNGEPFKGFGDEVPDAIEDVLNLSELNIRNQLNQFFLVTESPQEVARVINKVTGLEKVDEEWIPKLTKEINATKAKIELTSEDVLAVEQNISELKEEDIVFVERELKKANRLNTKKETIEVDIELLTDRIEQFAKLKAAVEALSYVEDVGLLLKEAEQLERKWEDVNDDTRSLQSKISSLLVLEEAIRKADTFDSIQSLLHEAESLHKELVEKLARIIRLDSEISTLDRLNEEIEYYGKRAESAKNRILDVGRCPLCLTELKAKQLEEIL